MAQQLSAKGDVTKNPAPSEPTADDPGKGPTEAPRLATLWDTTLTRRSVLKVVGLSAVGLGASGIVAACGGTSSPSAAGSAPVGSSAASAAQQPITLTYANWQSDASLENYKPGMRAFEKEHPGITIESPNYPQGYPEKLNTLLAAGTPPDLFINEAYITLDLAEQGVVLDLSPYLNDFPNLKDTLPQTKLYWEPDKYAGSAYFVQSLQTFYSKSAFDEAGLPYPPASADKAWTWDEFVQAAKKLTLDTSGRAADESGFDPNNIKQYGVHNLHSWWFAYYPFLLSAGAEVVDKDGTKYALNTPQAIAAIQALADLINVHHVAPQSQVAKGLPDAAASIADRRAAMSIDGQWTHGYLPALTDDWGVGVLPKIDTVVTALYPQTIAISSKTPHPREAAEFLSFFTDPETNPVYKIGNVMPALEAAYTDPAKLKTWTTDSTGRPPEYGTAVVDYVLNHSVLVPLRVKNFAKITDALTAGLDLVWSGQKAPEDAVRDLEGDIAPLLNGAYPEPPQ